MQKEKVIVLITGIGAVSLMLIGMGISLWKTKGQPAQASGKAETAAIVGGNKTDKVYNWIGSLSYDGKHRCGAVLVGTDTAITAAHCKDGDLDKWALQVPKSKTNLASSSKFKIKQWKTHPKYHHESYSYDVAILKIHGEFPPADKVIFASQLTAKNATVAGWGSVKEQAPGFTSDDSTSELHTATVPVVDKVKCEAIEKKKVADTLFCAGDWDAVIDSCTGDSGGPIFIPSHPPTLLGLVGGGEGCGSWETHGKYTYAKYITELLGKEHLTIQNTTQSSKAKRNTPSKAKLPSKTKTRAKTTLSFKAKPKSKSPATPKTKTRAKTTLSSKAKSPVTPKTKSKLPPKTKTTTKKRIKPRPSQKRGKKTENVCSAYSPSKRQCRHPKSNKPTY